MKIFALFALALVSIGMTSAYAWDGVTNGQVAGFEAHQDGSFYFWLVGRPNLCPDNAWASYGFAGVSQSFGSTPDGVKTMLAIVMSAKISGNTVTVYATNNPTDLCKVGVIGME